jgi:hypothetical protein
MRAIERHADYRIGGQRGAGDVVVVEHLAERAAGGEADADRHADHTLVAARRRCFLRQLDRNAGDDAVGVGREHQRSGRRGLGILHTDDRPVAHTGMRMVLVFEPSARCGAVFSGEAFSARAVAGVAAGVARIVAARAVADDADVVILSHLDAEREIAAAGQQAGVMDRQLVLQDLDAHRGAGERQVPCR